MLIDTKKGRKRARVETKLQAGDVMRWISEDQTAGFFRPDSHGSLQTLYNSFDNNDKFRFATQQGVAHYILALTVADACGLDTERDDKACNNWSITYVFKEKKS